METAELWGWAADLNNAYSIQRGESGSFAVKETSNQEYLKEYHNQKTKMWKDSIRFQPKFIIIITLYKIKM